MWQPERLALFLKILHVCFIFDSCLHQDDCDPFDCNIAPPTVPTKAPVTASPTFGPKEDTVPGAEDNNDPSPSAGSNGLGGLPSSTVGISNAALLSLVVGVFASTFSNLV
jgi:hypothetical protein